MIMIDQVTPKAKMFFIHCTDEEYMIFSPEGRYQYQLIKKQKRKRYLKAIKNFLINLANKIGG